MDGEGILRQLARLEISTWNYTWEDEKVVRHMGPMAQDFHAAFGLGRDELVITTQEADGVALAAVKALEARTARLRTADAHFRTADAEFRTANAQLTQRVASLEKALARLAGLDVAAGAAEIR